MKDFLSKAAVLSSIDVKQWDLLESLGKRYLDLEDLKKFYAFLFHVFFKKKY